MTKRQLADRIERAVENGRAAARKAVDGARDVVVHAGCALHPAIVVVECVAANHAFTREFNRLVGERN